MEPRHGTEQQTTSFCLREIESCNGSISSSADAVECSFGGSPASQLHTFAKRHAINPVQSRGSGASEAMGRWREVAQNSHSSHTTHAQES